jgi:hypothetical protein
MDIATSKLKTILKLKGVRIPYGDDEFDLLVKYKLSEISGLLGFNIMGSDESQTVYQFKDDRIVLTKYPVQSIESVTLNNEELFDECYTLDRNIGVVYFNKKLNGLLMVNYVTGLSHEDIVNVIEPLLVDMIAYDLTNNNLGDGVVSSIREGDVSVNYDTKSSLGNRVYTRIEELRQRYTKTARIRLI